MSRLRSNKIDKIIRAISTFSIALVFNVLAATQASTLLAGPHEITNWANNKAGAVSVTFDDNVISQYTLAVPALNARGFKGTFNVITSLTDTIYDCCVTLDEWKNVANQGHEIGSHTKTHPHLPQLTFTQMQDEIGGSQAEIDAQITMQKCVTFAYPFGDLNVTAELIAQDYYIAARGVTCELNTTPYDFYDMKACEDKLSVAQMKAKADEAEQEAKWLISYYHSLDGTGYGFWTIDMLTEYLDYLMTKNLWVDTFGSVTKYIKERASADLSLVSSSDVQIVLNLTDTLDDAIHDESLTIRSEVPSSWASVNVQQGSGVVTVTSVVEGTTRVIYYNVIPDRGFITLTKVMAPQTFEAKYSMEVKNDGTKYYHDGSDWVGRGNTGVLRTATLWDISSIDPAWDVVTVEVRFFSESKTGSSGEITVGRYGSSHGEDDPRSDSGALVYSKSAGSGYASFSEPSSGSWTGWVSLGDTAASDLAWCRDNGKSIWSVGLKASAAVEAGTTPNHVDLSEDNEVTNAEIRITYR